MPELTAAVARAVYPDLSGRVIERQSMAAFYAEAADRIGIAHFASDVTNSSWQCFPLRLADHVLPNLVVERCLQSGLQMRRYYLPLAGYTPHAPQAEMLSGRAICLPVYDGEDAGLVEEIWSIFSAAVNS